MRATELLLLATIGWTGIGVVGVGVSLGRGERHRVRRGVAWLAGVWAVYLCVLVGVSLAQRQKTLAVGQAQCYDDMCFTVTRVEKLPGFLIRDGRRLVRVSVLVSNRGSKAQSDRLIRVYLVDAQGRRWEESAGVNGVGLTAGVAGGGSVMCQPIFKVAGDATRLGLIFTHGPGQPDVLVIGDSDSLLHQRTIVKLGI